MFLLQIDVSPANRYFLCKCFAALRQVRGCRYICANAFRRSVRKANGRALDMIAGEKGNAEKALETEAGDDRIRKEPGKTERNWRAHTLPMDCFKGHKIKKMNPEQMVIDDMKPAIRRIVTGERKRRVCRFGQRIVARERKRRA